LNDGHESGPLIRVLWIDQVHPFACERQMSGAADGDEFGQALNQPEDYGFEN